MSLAAFLEVEKSLYERGCWPEQLPSELVGPKKKEMDPWEAHILREAEIHLDGNRTYQLLMEQIYAVPMYPENGTPEEIMGTYYALNDAVITPHRLCFKTESRL